MKLKKIIALALTTTTLLSIMTVSAFASTPIGETAMPINKRAEANCYITGSLGSAESTGICGGVYDSWFIETGSPVDGKDGYNMNTWENANDAITWTLSDGILTFSGTGGTALAMNLLFENNPYIEHIVIEEGITYFDGLMFSNLPNLETIIVMDASTDYGYLNPDVKETVDTIIIGANLKNSRTPEISKNDANSGTIILSNNIEYGAYNWTVTDADKPIIRDDATIYDSKNGDVIFQSGKMVETIFTAPAKAIKERTTMLPVNDVYAKAREALSDMPASIIAKLPSELTGVDTQNNAQTNVPTDTSSNPTQFGDVKPGAYYADAVKWAVEQGITSGTSNTTFSPDNTCTKAQILTFLWRANGSPDMTSFGASPFSDIKTSDYYYHAALWAYTKGMIHGMTFEPNTPCSRMDTVYYMWVAAGRPEIKTGNSFNDLNNGKYGTMHFNAVNWAVANSVTSGTSATTFSPENTCTRGQIATFLYRAFAD